jgi:hypothetical protein
MMLKQLAETARPVLTAPVILKIRRNHGLEHATIHVLSRRVKDLKIAGRSSARGFILMGDVPTDAVESAVRDALARMKNGEHQLAVHPNCGTNLVTTGSLTTLAAYLGLSGRSRRANIDRMASVLTLMMATVLFSQPLGLSLQRYFTTEGDVGDLEVVSVTRREVELPVIGRMVVHDVVTK